MYVPARPGFGKRYNRETLEVLLQRQEHRRGPGYDRGEAALFFDAVPSVSRILQTLPRRGPGLPEAGPERHTLSGGEAQRIKLSTELAKRGTGPHPLYLDEPTTGLHFEGRAHAAGVAQPPGDGATPSWSFEHNLDVIKSADHVLDMGPDGGNRGGIWWPKHARADPQVKRATPASSSSACSRRAAMKGKS